MIAPPRKTELGQDELRQRTRKLSQRHRTMLLLVDGRRSRLEVIDLAQKAGCAPSHFDELLAMGMVDEPSVPTDAAPLFAEAAERVEIEIAPPFVDTPSEAAPPLLADAAPLLTAHAAPLLTADAAPLLTAEAPEQPMTEMPTNGDAATPTVPVAVSLAQALPLEAAVPAPPTLADPAPVPTAVPSEERRLADRAVPVERRAARAKVAFSPPAEPPPPVRRSGPVPLVSLPTPAEALANQEAVVEPAHPRNPEQRLLIEVRHLLVGMLRVDNPLSGSLLALRVSRAKTRQELIALVWEIEHGLVRSRRPREGRARLERARDLLGLGNTLVAEDTGFGQGSQW